MSENSLPTTAARINSPHPLQGDGPGTPPSESQKDLRATTHPPMPGRATDTHHRIRKRANITIATLNINGASAPTANLNITDKWARINTTLRENKIAILALQETHLDDKRVEMVARCFGKSFTLLHSNDPDNPRTKSSIAIAINKALISVKDIRLHILVPGHVMMI